MSIKSALILLAVLVVASTAVGFIKGAIQQRKINKEAAKNAPPEEKNSGKDGAKNKTAGKDGAKGKASEKDASDKKAKKEKPKKKPEVKRPKRLGDDAADLREIKKPEELTDEAKKPEEREQ